MNFLKLLDVLNPLELLDHLYFLELVTFLDLMDLLNLLGLHGPSGPFQPRGSSGPPGTFGPSKSSALLVLDLSCDLVTKSEECKSWFAEGPSETSEEMACSLEPALDEILVGDLVPPLPPLRTPQMFQESCEELMVPQAEDHQSRG